MAKTSAKQPFFIWSCILHVSILLILILELSFSSSGHSGGSAKNQQKNIIHAVAVSAQAVKAYEDAEAQQKLVKQQAIQKIQELLKKQQAEQLAADKLVADKVAAEKAAAEKQVADKLMAEKLAAEKMAIEKAAAEKAAAEKLAAQKAEMLKQSLQKQLKTSMEKQLAQENKAANTTAKTSNTKPDNSVSSKDSANNINLGLLDKYKSLIIQAISEQWVVPANLPKNISCILMVRVAPGGSVLQVSVEKSSGNPILDNSAMAAVNKASPLPVPTEANLFERFRTLKLTVKPDGSMLES